jgi:response regulator RpfG family c-di-GMP phosphodiesterase
MSRYDDRLGKASMMSIDDDKATILVIDDNPLNLELLSRIYP